jgi:hypothetical protein
MSKAMIIFVQSKNPDPYVNAITHCVIHRNVDDLYFIGNKEQAGKGFETLETIESIINRLTALATQHNIYNQVRDVMPRQISNRIMRVVFVQPQDIIQEIKARFPNTDNLVIDITGTNKQLAIDVASAYITEGLEHVCHFELADKVFSSDWKHSKLYHDLTGGVNYYEYIDLAEIGVVKTSFDKLKRISDDTISKYQQDESKKWAHNLSIIFGGALFGAFIPGFTGELAAGRTILVIVYTVMGIIGLGMIFWGLRE